MKYKLSHLFLRIINNLVPKKKNQLLFDSNPDFSDNSRAFYDFLINTGLSKDYNLIWVFNDPNVFYKLSVSDMNVKAYLKFSFKGIWGILRSKYLFTTHNSFSSVKSRGQILIELWHGMPLKAMSFMAKNEDDAQLKYLKWTFDRNDLFIATSTVMKSALSSCLYVDPRKMHLTGQPRNDKLFHANGLKNLSDALDMDLSPYNKIVLCCPTYRFWESEGKTCGKLKEPEILDFVDYNEAEFQEFLDENKTLFLLKLHPFEEHYYLSRIATTGGNIRILKSENLLNKFLDLYDILNVVDVLVTDYSSIYFDFLLLNRPMIFINTDVKDYEKSSGFLFEPYNLWTPGSKTIKFRQFLLELKKCLNNPEYYKIEREFLNDIVNKYQDSKSSQRIFDLIFKGK